MLFGASGVSRNSCDRRNRQAVRRQRRFEQLQQKTLVGASGMSVMKNEKQEQRREGLTMDRAVRDKRRMVIQKGGR